MFRIFIILSGLLFNKLVFAANASDSNQTSNVCNTNNTSPLTLISAVQGKGETSPLLNQQVNISAVVTAHSDNGFFVQEEKMDEDGSDLTSEGIFVSTAKNKPSIGNTVQIKGKVTEQEGLSQISDIKQILDCEIKHKQALTTVELSFPLADGKSLEQYESMLVSIQDMTVFDIANLWRFGEIGLSTSVKQTPTDLYPPMSDAYKKLANANQQNIIYIEDTQSTRFPSKLSFYPEYGYKKPINVGDRVSTAGPLSFAGDQYRINPISVLEVKNQRTETPKLKRGNLSIASFNVLNYFNGEVGDSDKITFDYDKNRGAKSAKAFKLQQARIVSAIVGMNADLIGLVEVENDGFEKNSAIQSLVNEINKHFDKAQYYDFIRTADGNKIGTDAITVAIIYRPKVVKKNGQAEVIAMPSQLQVDGVKKQRMRPALVQTFTHLKTNTPFAVTVNHFKSKGSGCYEDEVNTTEVDRIQGRCNALRVSAALTLGNALVDLDLPENIMILGDLNSYSAEDPISLLSNYSPTKRGYKIRTALRTQLNEGNSVELDKNFGFVDVVRKFDKQGFSYWFYGSKQVGSLDFALASPEFMDDIIDASHWNINSVEAYQLQYNQALRHYPNKKGYRFSEIGPYRSSDHDPIIVSVEFK